MPACLLVNSSVSFSLYFTWIACSSSFTFRTCRCHVLRVFAFLKLWFVYTFLGVGIRGWRWKKVLPLDVAARYVQMIIWCGVYHSWWRNSETCKENTSFRETHMPPVFLLSHSCQIHFQTEYTTLLFAEGHHISTTPNIRVILVLCWE